MKIPLAFNHFPQVTRRKKESEHFSVVNIQIQARESRYNPAQNIGEVHRSLDLLILLLLDSNNCPDISSEILINSLFSPSPKLELCHGRAPLVRIEISLMLVLEMNRLIVCFSSSSTRLQ